MYLLARAKRHKREDRPLPLPLATDDVLLLPGHISTKVDIMSVIRHCNYAIK